EKVSGPGDTSPFQQGTSSQGFVTRFQPSMQEIHPDGSLTTPSVWDLHLHHVVWLDPGGGPTFASGEEKTIAKEPQGYGLKVGGNATWGLNYMIHSLNATSGRQVQITWQIDWVPANPDPGIKSVDVQWMDVAGAHIYPVFDATKRNDLDGDGKYVFPDDVPTNPSDPGYDQRANIGPGQKWTVPSGGRTLVFGGGHLHPGGKHVGLDVSRDLNGD